MYYTTLSMLFRSIGYVMVAQAVKDSDKKMIKGLA